MAACYPLPPLNMGLGLSAPIDLDSLPKYINSLERQQTFSSKLINMFKEFEEQLKHDEKEKKEEPGGIAAAANLENVEQPIELNGTAEDGVEMSQSSNVTIDNKEDDYIVFINQ